MYSDLHVHLIHHKVTAINDSPVTDLCFVRVSSGCGPAAGDQRQGGQPEQSPGAGEGGCRTGQQGGPTAGGYTYIWVIPELEDIWASKLKKKINLHSSNFPLY